MTTNAVVEFLKDWHLQILAFFMGLSICIAIGILRETPQLGVIFGIMVGIYFAMSTIIVNFCGV